MEKQMLSAQVTLIIPEDKVLVDKVEYQELKKSKEITWNSMQEFCRYAGWNSVTMTKILLKPEVRNIIDISRNDNGWAYYGLGNEVGVIVQDEDGSIKNLDGAFKTKNQELVGAWARVHLKNHEIPIYVAVSYDEYVQMKDVYENWTNVKYLDIK